ncbi:hypothetical protein GCM10010329_41870 [Streptomyces spiroverticillatus]|nr:hypothetical protein GCM10010329_41870 [Streptomyces spiroverticillatus]
MVDQNAAVPDSAALHDFATWEPLLRILRIDGAVEWDAPYRRVRGSIGLRTWDLAAWRHLPSPGRAATEAMERIRRAPAAAGLEEVMFDATAERAGRTTMRLHGSSPAVESGGSPYPGGAPSGRGRGSGAVASPARSCSGGGTGSLHRSGSAGGDTPRAPSRRARDGGGGDHCRGATARGHGPADWRVLLDAGAVPRSLLAAKVRGRETDAPLTVTALANEIPTLWNRPLIVRTVLDGDLGPRSATDGAQNPTEGVRYSS